VWFRAGDREEREEFSMYFTSIPVTDPHLRGLVKPMPLRVVVRRALVLSATATVVEEQPEAELRSLNGLIRVCM
jgi:hypothetical protein